MKYNKINIFCFKCLIINVTCFTFLNFMDLFSVGHYFLVPRLEYWPLINLPKVRVESTFFFKNYAPLVFYLVVSSGKSKL